MKPISDKPAATATVSELGQSRAIARRERRMITDNVSAFSCTTRHRGVTLMQVPGIEQLHDRKTCSISSTHPSTSIGPHEILQRLETVLYLGTRLLVARLSYASGLHHIALSPVGAAS